MELPEHCKGCPELQAIIDRPIQTAIERIESATNEKVQSTSWVGDMMHRAPDMVLLSNGQDVDSRIVSRAYRDAEQEVAVKEFELAALSDSCPGFVEAQAVIPGHGAVLLRLCGRKAIEGIVTLDGATSIDT